jgi:hypothetical protein
VVSVRAVRDQRCRLLEEDPDLADTVLPERRQAAAEELTADAIRIAPGAWAPSESEFAAGGVGLLVIRGLLLRRVGIEGRYGAELLGECDILRPLQREDGASTLLTTTGWSVIEPTRLAVLDELFTARLARYPELVARLIGRAVGRSRQLAVNMAIVHQARVDVRLHMLLWHLAGRWGRVRSDGTMLPMRLTHAFLADLVAARRPTVTSALSELSRRGLLRYLDDGWLLIGDPPGELLGLSDMTLGSRP